jgi:hypothetical protein
MKEFFAWIYDTVFGIFNNGCFEIFNHLFNNGGYIKFGLSFILIPLVCWFLFYYFWKYPYGKIWHWVLWLVVTILIISGITYGIANSEIFGSDNQALNELMADESTGYANYAATLPLKYALANSLLTIAIGIIYSLFMKQLSKVQIHLPF